MKVSFVQLEMQHSLGPAYSCHVPDSVHTSGQVLRYTTLVVTCHACSYWWLWGDHISHGMGITFCEVFQQQVISIYAQESK